MATEMEINKKLSKLKIDFLSLTCYNSSGQGPLVAGGREQLHLDGKSHRAIHLLSRVLPPSTSGRGPRCYAVPAATTRTRYH